MFIGFWYYTGIKKEIKPVTSMLSHRIAAYSVSIDMEVQVYAQSFWSYRKSQEPVSFNHASKPCCGLIPSLDFKEGHYRVLNCN